MILITGGAGYIGSHTVRQMTESGHSVLVLDDLSTGFRDALIHDEKFIQGNVGNENLLDEIFTGHRIDSVVHFAASIVVPESVSDPLKYFENNTSNAVRLLKACVKHKVQNFVFSSTAAVYKESVNPAREDAPLFPLSPYGESKMMTERILQYVAQAHGLKFVILRYFNVAGADPKGRMGQRSENATHLIKVCCEAAVGKRRFIEMFGTDYPTPDGTCLRDYLHVEDLAQAHILALRFLKDGGRSAILNVGYGKGASVKQVINKVQEVTGKSFEVRVSGRRDGDAPALIADSTNIQNTLGWSPQFDDLEKIVSDAWKWECKLSGLDK